MALDKFQPYLFVSAGEQSNKYLTPVISPDGIASFQAQRAQAITGLTVRIDPIQEGTGDPSPTNIRPISGRTGLTVTAKGKNLFDKSAVTMDVLLERSDGSLTTNTGYAVSDYIPVASGSQVTFTGFNYFYQRYYDSDKNLVSTLPANTATVTIPSGVSFLRVSLLKTNLDIAQLEIGNTATAYTPYVAPTEIPISWQTQAGTVYGGTLDVVSGVLTVTHAAVDMGTLNYTYDSSGGRFYTSVSGKKNEASDSEMMLSISSMYKPMTASAFQNNPTNGTMRGATTGGYCYFRNDAYTDAAAFKTAMEGQTLVYELATPQIYQLTPTEVRTLAGYNQVYSDAGPVIDIKF